MDRPPATFGERLPRPKRREFLRVGLAGALATGGGLTLPGLLRARDAAASPADQPRPPARPEGERTALIVVWLHGGASHFETYDPKPLAPLEIRGPYQPIATRTPGLSICELLPRHAALSHRYTILRSMAHTGFCHQQGLQQLFTGHDVRELRNKPDHPDCFTIANKVRFRHDRTLPNYVGAPPVPYAGAAYLGATYEPFVVYGNPNAPEFTVPNVALSDEKQTNRVESRRSLRQEFDRLRHDADRTRDMDALDTFEEQAWHMLTSPDARRAFDLAQEDPRTRDRYGRTQWGQQCLLARRLVEAGVDLVTTTLAGPEAGPVHNWDDHAVNCHVFDTMRFRAANFDRAVTALIEELYERGLDRRVMVVVTGEFGRTPTISYSAGRPGRDHWPSACSMLFAGGGIEAGQVIGATDSRGGQVIERRVGPKDFLATIYRHLGIETAGLRFNDFAGRPVAALDEGTPIPELVARA